MARTSPADVEKSKTYHRGSSILPVACRAVTAQQHRGSACDVWQRPGGIGASYLPSVA
jgi:hypothetical protein